MRKIVPDGDALIHFVGSDSLVDHNVFHVKQDHFGRSYIAVKYDINDMHEYLFKINNKHLFKHKYTAEEGGSSSQHALQLINIHNHDFSQC